jgi:hypothetical protein
MERLESEIAEWRAFIERSPAVDNGDIEELEAHLRDQIIDLKSVGLASDEAFLIAVKRMGSVDELSREFAHEHSGRLWRQLVDSEGTSGYEASTRWLEMLGFALGAAIAIQLARLAAGFPSDEPSWLLRNISLFVLPFLAGYFSRRRGLERRKVLATALPFAVAAVVVNVYPFTAGGPTELLVAAHLPVAMWFAVAYPYTGGAIRSHERRMDFVRFTGEWFIYYVLIALGGGVLVALASFVLEPTGVVDPEQMIEWILPSGAAGAVVVAAWLVESKQRVVENMAPVLTMVFTPLFALMLTIASVVYLATGLGGAFDRELIGVFDALLVVVFGLVLYGVSARETTRPPGWMDRMQLVTVLAALLLDLVVLGAMLSRIGELGFTPNRTAALGLNLVLMINLIGTAWVSARFLSGRGTFHRTEQWQTAYLPIFALWAAAVVVLLPPVFSFV